MKLVIRTFVIGSLLLPIAGSERNLYGDDYTDRPTWLVPKHPRDDDGFERLTGEALVLEARILQKQGDFQKAIRRYQRALRFSSGSTTILKQIIPLALELGRVEEATRYALLLTESDLDDPFLAERLALLMSEQLQFDRSLQLYQRVLKLRNQDVHSRNPIAMQFEMGRLYFLTEKYQQAAQSFRSVLKLLDSETQDRTTQAFRRAIFRDARSTYTLMAEAFLEAGEFEDAATAFRKANGFSPDQQWLTFQLARVDHRAGRFESAQEKLQNYVRQKLNFGGQTPYRLLQTMMERAKEKTIAKVAESNKQVDQTPETETNTFVRFRDWLADDPDNFPLLSYVAEMTRRQGILQDAAALYQESVRKQPSSDAYRNLLRIYRELGDTDQLLDTLSDIVLRSRDFENYGDEVRRIVGDKELLRDLTATGKERLQGSPKHAKEIAIACGLIALEAKQYLVAEEFFGKLREDKQDIDLYLTWGLQLLVDKKFSQAASVFQTGLKVAQDSQPKALLMYYLSGALQLDGRTDEALEVATNLARLSPEIPEFSLRPAWILFNAGRHADAKTGYLAWLSRHGEDYSVPGLREVVRDARFVLSSISVELQQIDVAVEALEKILDEYPEDAAAMNDLGYLLVDENRSLKRALRMIRAAVEQEPENPMYRDSLGWAYFRLGDFDKAVTELAKAASEEPPDPIILDHLAEAQLAAGNLREAFAIWRRIQRMLKPNEQAPDQRDLNELRTKIKNKLRVELSTAEAQ